MTTLGILSMGVAFFGSALILFRWIEAQRWPALSLLFMVFFALSSFLFLGWVQQVMGLQ